MRLIFTLLCTIALLASCKPNIKSDANQALYEEVMAVHDEVMPKMSDMHKLRKQIRKAYPDKSVAGYEQSLTVLAKLEEADEGMMEWMANFKVPEETDAAQQKAYLMQEKVAIRKVSDDMYAAMATAKTILQ